MRRIVPDVISGLGRRELIELYNKFVFLMGAV
jgi:hypothetical protein